MQAAKVGRFGGPEVLVASEVPDPVAGPGEVVIGVAFADVLWVEAMIRRGGGGEFFDVTPPYVPGNGVAGRVGEAGDWVQQARTALGGEGADVILDNIGGPVGEAALGAIAPGGRFSAHGTPSGRFAVPDAAEVQRLGVAVRGIRDVQLADADLRRLTEQALAEAAAGRVRPVVGQVFPLAQAGAAHGAIERRDVFGKTLLAA